MLSFVQTWLVKITLFFCFLISPDVPGFECDNSFLKFQMFISETDRDLTLSNIKQA